MPQDDDDLTRQQPHAKGGIDLWLVLIALILAPATGAILWLIFCASAHGAPH